MTVLYDITDIRLTTYRLYIIFWVRICMHFHIYSGWSYDMLSEHKSCFMTWKGSRDILGSIIFTKYIVNV